ncbi:anti-sigma factor domain-containing protein [Arthrobacter bussei]|uniref:Anti-sigma factor n=1 Tax=Arthrobacter bussei TaxID=2594179 RepID=A0A7X1TML2_9MICC|nr:anti-sigma factor [Arthrobacter bussei]MPY09819.1 anti-sigma factor [Arthrobacter bussei]
MQHLDPESISLAALGEDLDESARAHLDGCDTCAMEVDDLHEVVRVARAGDDGHLDSPDPAVWAGIHAELGLGPAHLEDPLTRTASARGGLRAVGTGPGPGDVTPMKGRSFRRPFGVRHLAAAATVGVLVGGGALWAVQVFASPPAPEVLAETVLEPLDGSTAEGTATVVSGEGGVRSLDVRSTAGEGGGFEEVWLIAPELDRMYSLGVLHGGDGSLTIPDSVDLDEFPIVDVSDEPLDGDPTHSGVSVLRGTLAAGSGRQQD